MRLPQALQRTAEAPGGILLFRIRYILRQCRQETFIFSSPVGWGDASIGNHPVRASRPVSKRFFGRWPKSLRDNRANSHSIGPGG